MLPMNVLTVNSSAHSCRLWRVWNGVWNGQDYRKGRGRRQRSPSNLASVQIGFSERTTLLIADLDFSKKVILQICQPEVVLAFRYET